MNGIGLLVAVFIFFAFGANSQIKTPEKGTVWVYDYSNAGIGGPLVALYDRDTVLAGKQAIIFEQTLYNRYTVPGEPKIETIHWDTHIIGIEDSAVLWWDNDQYLLVYDFGEAIGTKRIIRSYEKDTLTAETIEKGVHEHLGCF
ncbi:hypothetical protein N8368_05330, partial [Bacteroidia bacterium]|nr:hypothetical protein [Bacteroidia bacterium]MDB9882667.1 hypothetical protein [Bacteroidia bacterium]MDC1395910.1 hypothetical protein [Bacteroidia bacterium]